MISQYRAMDGLIVIRSITLSNHIKTTRLLERVVAGCYQMLWGCGRDNAITPKEERKAIKSQRQSKELRASSTGLAFKEH